MEGKEHIQKLLRSLKCENPKTSDNYSITHKITIKKGSVALDLPVISFQDGQFPPNNQLNTLAFRMTIPIDRESD